jgi:hypothetical protein
MLWREVLRNGHSCCIEGLFGRSGGSRSNIEWQDWGHLLFLTHVVVLDGRGAVQKELVLPSGDRRCEAGHSE